jgi:hypothetical protein
MSKTVYSVVGDDGRTYADNILDATQAEAERVNITSSMGDLSEIVFTVSKREVSDEERILGA